MQRALAGGFDFLLAPLGRQRDSATVLKEGVSPIPDPPVSRSEFLLNSTQARTDASKERAGGGLCELSPHGGQAGSAAVGFRNEEAACSNRYH